MNSNSIIDHRDANIILGYLPKIDFYPNQLKHEKPLRFAIAFNCYYPCVDGHYFLDRELITNTCNKIIGSHSCHFFDDKKQAFRFDDLGEVIDQLGNVTVYEDSRQIALLNICRWDMTGGPKEYHDRYTIEVFTSEQYFENFLRLAKESLARDKCNTTHIKCPEKPMNNWPDKIYVLFRNILLWRI